MEDETVHNLYAAAPLQDFSTAHKAGPCHRSIQLATMWADVDLQGEMTSSPCTRRETPWIWEKSDEWVGEELGSRFILGTNSNYMCLRFYADFPELRT